MILILIQFIYRAIYLFFMFCFLFFYPLLPFKLKAWIDLRNKTKKQNHPSFKSDKVIWFHAASGEIEYCKSVITEIKSESPECLIVLSYTSPSAEKLFDNIKNSIDFIFPLPWDSPREIKKIIRSIKPKLIVFSRTDFWPELIYQSRQHRIPLAAISIFPQKHNLFSQWNYSWLLKRFQYITAVNTESLSYLEKILPGINIKYYPDSRFDQVTHRLASPSKIDLSHEAPLFTLGSTWPEDESVVLPTLRSILEAKMKIALAPHDISRVPYLLKEVQFSYPDLKIVLLSDFIQKPTSFDILMIDQIGYLADIYRYSTFTFVGGSFKKRVHSVMEPLCAQNIVLFGPYYKNNPEAIESLQQKLSFQISCSQDIVEMIKTYNLTDVQTIKAKIKDFSQKQTGSSKAIALELLKI